MQEVILPMAVFGAILILVDIIVHIRKKRHDEQHPPHDPLAARRKESKE
jgi:hypothetical protein